MLYVTDELHVLSRTQALCKMSAVVTKMIMLVYNLPARPTGTLLTAGEHWMPKSAPHWHAPCLSVNFQKETEC